MAWVACLRRKCASMVGVGGVGDVLVRVAGCIACVAWVGMVVCLWGWHAGIGGISGALTWVAFYYHFYCYY